MRGKRTLADTEMRRAAGDTLRRRDSVQMMQHGLHLGREPEPVKQLGPESIQSTVLDFVLGDETSMN
jgi:hypothetical protein